tara:strand:+ start:23 stop:247 length:225 start_codon:yes stop_codon:yes gene_type:complete
MIINYDITNYKKFNWYDTQTYKSCGDDNEGHIHGYVEWYGNQDLDDALDYSDDDVYWFWFKTEQERDKSLKEQD